MRSVNLWRRCLGFSRSWLALAAIGFGGCMLTPTNGQHVSSTSATVPVSGFVTRAKTDVSILASAMRDRGCSWSSRDGEERQAHRC